MRSGIDGDAVASGKHVGEGPSAVAVVAGRMSYGDSLPTTGSSDRGIASFSDPREHGDDCGNAASFVWINTPRGVPSS